MQNINERDSAKMLRQTRQRWLALEIASFLSSVGVLLWVMRGLLFGGEQMLSHDNALWGYPIFGYFADGVLHGHLPLWNPFSHGGEPLMAAYLQLRLLDPINILTILVAGCFTAKLSIIFCWCWLAKCLIASTGVQFLMRQWAKNPFTRAALAPIAVLSSLTLNSFHQDGFLNQFYCAPFMLFFIFRLLEGRHEWPNWMGACFFFGQCLQSYFFVGSLTAILSLLIGYAVFRREPLYALMADRQNFIKAGVSAMLLVLMAAPTLAIFVTSGEFRFSARNVPLQWSELLPNGGPVDYDLAREESAPDALQMPYNVVRLTGTSSRPSDALGLFAPPSQFFPAAHIVGEAVAVVSEASLYYGGLTFLVALIGMFCAKHPLKGPWMFTLVLFGLILLGPRTPLHWLLYQIYPALWFERHTHLLASFFGLSLLFFFVLGADRLLAFRLPLATIPDCPVRLRNLLRGKAVVATIFADAASTAAAGYFAIWAHARGAHGLAIAPIIAVCTGIALREACLAKRIVSRDCGLVMFYSMGLVALGIDLIVIAWRLFPQVPVGQLRPDWLAMPAVATLVLLLAWPLRSLAMLAIAAALFVAGIGLTTTRMLYSIWVVTFCFLPATALYAMHVLGRRDLRKVAGAIMVGAIFLELVIAHEDIGDNEVVARSAVEGKVPIVAGGLRFPLTRLAAIPAPLSPDNYHPDRYPELLAREGVAFDTPRSYPDGPFVDDAVHVLTGYRWNAFVVLTAYDQLIHSGLNPAICAAIFGVDASIFQFKTQARATDNFLTEGWPSPVQPDGIPWSGDMSFGPSTIWSDFTRNDRKAHPGDGDMTFQLPPTGNARLRYYVALGAEQLAPYAGRSVQFIFTIRQSDPESRPIEVGADDGVTQSDLQSFKLHLRWERIVTAPHFVPRGSPYLIFSIGFPALEQSVVPPNIFIDDFRIATFEGAEDDPNTSQAVRLLADTVFLDKTTLPVGWHAPQPSVRSAKAKITVKAADFDAVSIGIETQEPGYLYIADAYTPDWTATVNGSSVPIMRADGGFKAVAVDRGTSTVRIAYRPRVAILTLALFYASLAVSLAVGLSTSKKQPPT